MLTLRIDLAQRRPKWTYTDGRWHSSAGIIQPFTHPCLTTTAHQSAPDSLYLHITSADGDSLTLYARPGTVMIKAGTYATAPLYLAPIGNTVHASWRMADVARLTEPWRLLDRQIVRLLTRQHRYTTDTPSEQVHRLTAGTTAVIHGGQITLDYPEAHPRISQRRQLRPAVDPIDAFDRVIKTAMASYVPDHNGTVGTELSGGADSANVALSARGLLADTPLYSVGLTLPPPAGERQDFRRLTFARHMQLTDTTVPAQDHLPFNPCGRRFAGPHDPASSYYSEAFDAVARTAAARGVKLMLTGFGADEVMSTPSHAEPTALDLPPWLGPRALAALDQINTNTAPPTAVSAPTLMACASHSPAYLAVGIWPVAPFANPAVSRFARQLPPEWATDKRLLRERLIRAGIPPLAARPQDGEDFTPIMHQALRAHALPLLNELADSLTLASLGFVEPVVLRDTLKRAHDTPTPPSTLVDLLRLELGLRSLWRSEQTRTAVGAARHNEQPHHRPDDERRADAAALA